MSGEKVSANESEIQEFIGKLDAKINELGLVPEQIYNADETGLNWRQLPTKSFVTEDEKKVSGRKLQKERITLMVCANASETHKLKNVKAESLPVTYMCQSRAWVTKEVFHDWYFKRFVPRVKQELKKEKLPVKALLLLDNAIKTADGYIEVKCTCPKTRPL